MEYRSKVAALACFAVVSIGMTGCSSSTSPTDAPAAGIQPAIGTTGSDTQQGAASDEACPIPLAVQQPLELNLSKTSDVLSFTGSTLELNLFLLDQIGDGMLYSSKSIQSTSEKLITIASILGNKIKTIQADTATIKESLSEGSVIFGDNLPCDNYNAEDQTGTYSAHMSHTERDGEVDDTNVEEYMDKLEVTFNECTINEENPKMELFMETLWSTSLLFQTFDGLGADPVPVTENTYTFNGAASLEFNDKYTFQDNNWDDGIAPRDSGSSNNWTGSGEVHLIENALSIVFKENNVEIGNYFSDQNIFISFNSASYHESNTDYENESNEGNRTDTTANSETMTWHIAMDINENYTLLDESNSATLTALCYTAYGSTETTYTDTDHYVDVVPAIPEPDIAYYVDDAHDINNNTQTIDTNIESSGYLALTIMEDSEVVLFVDSYSDALEAAYSRDDINNYSYVDGDIIHEESDEATFTLDGAVGSTLLGGSVVIDTQTPWKMSPAFSVDRSEVMAAPEDDGPEYENPFDMLDDTPYAGKTVVTGTNTATIMFGYDETEVGNITYGSIQIDEETPQEYDSIEDMISDTFDL